MSIEQIIFVATCWISIGIGVVIYRARADRPIWERLAIAALPFLGCTILWHWAVSIAFQALAGAWGGARLAPALGLMYHYQLYYPPTEGPLNGWIYPPLSSLAYLPAVWFGDSGVMILMARGLSLVYYYAPAACLLLWGGGRRRPGLGRILLFVSFVLLTTNSLALRYSSTEIHADAPALGLAGMAVVVMVRGGGGRNPWACGISVILAVMAVWAKQLTIPILMVILPAYAFATGALARPSRTILPGVVGGLGITLILLAIFEPQGLMFNVVHVPRHHPLRIGALIDFFYPVVILQEKHGHLLMLLAVGLLSRAAAASPDGLGGAGGPARVRFLEGGWPIFVIAAMAEGPLSLMGYVGVGGGDNSWSFSFYFLALGALTMLEPFVASGGEGGRVPVPWFWYLLLGMDLMLAAFEDQTLGLSLIKQDQPWRKSRQAERFIREHPGEAYFPWNPEAHLVVEGKYYHFEDGIYDRSVSGFPPTPEHFSRHIPPRTRLVCYPPFMIMGNGAALKYLNGFRQTKVPELPGWDCFERPPSPDPSTGDSSG